MAQTVKDVLASPDVPARTKALIRADIDKLIAAEIAIDKAIRASAGLALFGGFNTPFAAELVRGRDALSRALAELKNG